MVKHVINKKERSINIMKKRKQNIFETKKKGVVHMNLKSKQGFGINEIIGIAAGVIIAAVVVIPGLRDFAQTIMTELSAWWEGMSAVIFA